MLGHVEDHAEARSIVRRLMAGLPAGSYLVQCDGTDSSEAYIAAIEQYRDEGGDTVRVYRDVAPILTPRVLAAQQATWRVLPALTLTAAGRYQGRSFLAPTGNPALTAPPFFVLDGGALVGVGRYTVLVQGRNLLDRRAYPSGNVSGSGVARYYILAPRNVVVTARLPF